MGNLIFRDGAELKKEDLIRLYNNVGWSSYTQNIDTLKKSIHNSLKVITACDNETLVGLIRVVGDGYSIVYIQDILVLQEYQNNGIGKKLIEIVLNKYKDVRQKVLLTDNKDKTILFYKKVGFLKAEEFVCIVFAKFKNN